MYRFILICLSFLPCITCIWLSSLATRSSFVQSYLPCITCIYLPSLLPDHHLSRVTSHALLVFIYLPCYQFIFVFKVTSHALLVYTYLPCYKIIPDINEVEFVLFRIAVRCGDT